MSRKIVLACLAALLATCTFASVALAQQARDLREPGSPIGPFIDPDYFDPDYQFFAPSDLEVYDDQPEAHVGYYFTYDRMFINVGRPEGAPSLNSGYDGDFTWGNRFDLGFMTNDDKGWLITISHIDGPNENFAFNQERLDRFNPDDDDDDDDTVPADNNPRVYEIVTSINDADLQTFEISKTWRQHLHRGGILEPFVGLRQATFRDRFRRDTYGRFLVGPTGLPDLTSPDAEGPSEVYVQNEASSENFMLGTQFGFRYFKQVSSWTISTELRMFAMQNWQYFDQSTSTTSTVYTVAGGPEESPVRYQLVDKTLSLDNGAQFVWGGDLRGEATYEVTRDIALRVGFVMTDYARGLGRGNPATQNRSQDLFMGGLTFGVAINR